MKRTRLSALCRLFSTNAQVLFYFLCAAPLLTNAQIQITPDRANANYDVGETATFQVSAFTSGTLNYEFRYDDYTPAVQTGNIQVQAGIPTTISYSYQDAGVLLLKANLNGQMAKSAAVWGATKIRSAEPEPADFDAFWNAQKAMIQAVPHDAQLSLIADNGKTKDYQISLANVDGRRVHGYISVPNGSGPFPALLHLPPFGSGAGLVAPDTWLTDELGAIVMHISIHNAPANQTPSSPYAPNDPTDRDQYYYRWAILGALQAIDYLASRPDVDAQYIGVFGESQGGGLSMITAGLDNRVKLLMSTIPALCDHTGWKYGKASGFPQYMHWASVSSFGNQSVVDAVGNACRYYDAQYFVKRYSGPLYTAASYLDEICPSNTVLSAHNQHTGPQIIVHSTKLEHTHPGSYWTDRPSMARLYFPPCRTPQNNPFPPSSTGYRVSAGTDKTAQVGQPLTLTASIEQNLQAKSGLTASWEMISGPAPVSFSGQNGYSTQATFSQNGTYLLRFNARDESTIGSNYFYTLHDVVVVTVSGSGGSLPSLGLTNVTVGEGQGQVAVNICLSAPATQNVSFAYSTINGTATAGADYTATLGTGTIPAGSSCTTINIPLLDDQTVEGNETFTLNISNAIGATLGNSTSIITIQDNDVALPSVSVSNTSVGEGAGSVAVLVCLSAAADQNVTVNYTTVNGTAASGLDFTQTNGQATITAGTTCTTITIPILEDPATEGDETFYLNLSSPNGAQIGTGSATITIQDNDSAPPPQITIQNASASEGNATVEVNVCLNQTFLADVFVDFSTADGSAVQGVDYVAQQGTLTIPAGSLCGSIFIEILDDAFTENTETFQVNLSNPTGGVLANTMASVSIQDNDNGTPGGNTPCWARSENYWEMWIEHVGIKDMNSYTGGAAYTFFENKIVETAPQDRIEVILDPKFGSSAYRVYWRIWVDWNDDGDFDDSGETVFQRSGFGQIRSNFTVPASTINGKKRVRVIAKKNGYPQPCGSLSVGEVEDYILNISPNTPTCTLSANVNEILCNNSGTGSDPSDDTWTFKLNVSGQNTSQQGYVATFDGNDYFGSYGTPLTFTAPNPNGQTQTLQVRDSGSNNCTTTVSVTAPTPCSTDQPPATEYCAVESAFPWHEWIQAVGMNGTVHKQSSKTTYSNFTATSIPLSAGANTFKSTAEFSWITEDLYWKVWIDYNKDNRFEITELVAQGQTNAPTPGSGAKVSFEKTFTTPNNVATGTTRMRVMMSPRFFENPCQNLEYGEIEDYTVELPNTLAKLGQTEPVLSASIEQGLVRLIWQTNMENVQKAWIEKTTESGEFDALVQEVNAHALAGSVYDEHPDFGENQYRLAVQTLGGTLHYSPIATLEHSDVSIFPNPARSVLNVETSMFETGSQVNWTIKDLHGRTVSEGQTTPQGSEKLQIRLDDVKSGLYILRLTASGQRSSSQRFVVEKG